MDIGLILAEVNWTNITNDWEQFAMQGYNGIFGTFTYPLIFIGIIGYIYCLNKSAITAAAAICILFTVYGVTGIFAAPDTAEFSYLSYLIVIFSFSGLFTALFMRHRG